MGRPSSTLEDSLRNAQMITYRSFGCLGVAGYTCSEDLSVALGLDSECVV